MRITSVLTLGGAALLAASFSSAQPLDVMYQDGLVSIQCVDAPLSGVFQQIEERAGVELILEDGVKSKRLTASFADVPLALAVQRLLEGVGVNYVVMMDPFDWDRVGKIFVGSGGGGPARASSAPAPVMPDEPVEEVYDEMPADFDEAAVGMEGTADFGDAMDPGVEAPPDEMPQSPEELGPEGDPGEFAPPGSSPLPDFFPAPQTFPKSSFTPGLPSRTQQRQQAPSPEGIAPTPEDPANVPPAMYPFTDPFGRPIPIPPGMNPQQQQQQQQQQKSRNPQQQQQE